MVIIRLIKSVNPTANKLFLDRNPNRSKFKFIHRRAQSLKTKSWEQKSYLILETFKDSGLKVEWIIFVGLEAKKEENVLIL
jgi:hypothetical protein